MSTLKADTSHNDVTYRVIGAAMQVHNEHGPGHREEVYHRALAFKMPLAAHGLSFEDEPAMPVYAPEGTLVYSYCPDFVVEQAVIVEIKAQTHLLTKDDWSQVFDYFAVSSLQVALLINFGRPRLEYKRPFPPKHIQARRQWGKPTG